MIFVTVGTDHHPFDRLIEAVDRFKSEGLLQETVFIQSGASLYRPRSAEYQDFLPYDVLMDRIEQARIIITHGGPGSIMPALYLGKVPVVLARKKEFGEAVDDHQLDFARKLDAEGILLHAEDVDDLEEKIQDYDKLILENRGGVDPAARQERLEHFISELDSLCLELVGKKSP